MCTGDSNNSHLMVETSVLGCVFLSVQVIVKDTPDSQIFWSAPIYFVRAAHGFQPCFEMLWGSNHHHRLSLCFFNSLAVPPSLPASLSAAKSDPVFEMPSCSLVRHQSIWRCPEGVLALTKVYLEMESSSAFGPQQTQPFTVIKDCALVCS